MRKSADEQKLDQLEAEFRPLLRKCLDECARQRRWGLFGQNSTPEAERCLRWEEAEHLRSMALGIREIRSQWGETNSEVEAFLRCCDERGANTLGEPKRAAALLKQVVDSKL